MATAAVKTSARPGVLDVGRVLVGVLQNSRLSVELHVAGRPDQLTNSLLALRLEVCSITAISCVVISR